MNSVHGMSGPRPRLAQAAKVGVLVFGFGGGVALADEPSTPKPSVEELEKRIEILEQKLAAQEAAVHPPAPAVASAQINSPVVEQQAAATTVSAPQVFAGPSGFAIQSADGSDQIRFHGEFDFDGRFYNDNLTPDGSRSSWQLGRARPIIEGTFDRIFDFRFNPDFAGGKTVIQDAFVAARFNPLFVVTAGKFKEPFGLERLQFSPNNRFISLGLPSDIVPNRDLGLQISGTVDLPSGNLTYQVGYFDGVNDGASTDANTSPDVDNNDKKDLVGRIFSEPFKKTDIAALRGLGAGIAVGYVNQVGNASNTLLPTYKTETQRSFFTYAPATTASGTIPATGATYADGERLRVSPQAYYYYQSFGLLTEYVKETQDVARTFGTGPTAFTRRAALKPDSWQVAATYLLTGDTATFGTLVPNHPFRVDGPGWGAFEVAARISQLSLDPETFSTSTRLANSWFADPTTQASKATAWTLGLNWYLTQNVVWYVDYTVTRFDGGAPPGTERPNESAFFTQLQLAF